MSSSDAGAGLLRRARCAVLLVWNNVTIEPVVMLYLTAYGLNEVRSQLIQIRRAVDLRIRSARFRRNQILNSKFAYFIKTTNLTRQYDGLLL